MIPDGPSDGLGAFVATKKFKTQSGGRGDSRAKVTAIAVRERGTKDFAKIIRFCFSSLPYPIEAKLSTWVAVPSTAETAGSDRLLFKNRSSEGRIQRGTGSLDDARSKIEGYVLANCAVLTVGQRCADWFVMRQFRITGTIAAKVLLSDSGIREMVGLSDRDDDVNLIEPKALLCDLMSSWFSSARSTESMMRGTINEPAVMEALTSKDFVIAVFEVGMLALPSSPWLACSPDGVALIKVQDVDDLVVCPVEIKSFVASSSLDRMLASASVSVIYCEVGDDIFRKIIPDGHIGQLLMQMVVLDSHFIVYVAASETGILNTVVVTANDVVLMRCKRILMKAAESTIAWLHSDPVEFPAFVPRDIKGMIETQLPFQSEAENYQTKPNRTFRSTKQLNDKHKSSLIRIIVLYQYPLLSTFLSPRQQEELAFASKSRFKCCSTQR